MNVRTLSASLACLIALSACGGGNTTDSSKSALDGACTPASGPAGTQVTCSVKDVDDDCTFFFAGTPTDFTLDAEKETFSFTVPGGVIATAQPMSFQCGGDEPQSAGTFDVIASANPDESPANGDEEITPTGTAGEGTGGTTTGEGTTGGTTGGETTGTETPEPTTTSATINSFTVTPVTGSSTRLSTFQVSYSYSNAQAAYIWGNMLNRNSWDATLDASEGCKLQGGRYLATNSDGTDLTSGSENYEKWQYASEGTRCDDSTECLSQSSSSGLVMQKVSTPAHMVQVSPLEQASPIVQASAPTETSTNCRVDLHQADGTPVVSDTFYTHSLVQYGNLCLAVQGTDGNWQVQCVSGDALPVDFDSYNPVKIAPSTTKVGFDMSLNAVNATAVQVYCTQDEDDIANRTFDINQFTGAASYSGVCEVDAETKTVTVRIYGVGDYNVVQKTYTLTMDKPTVTLKLVSSAPDKYESSKIDLEYSATRPYTIKDEAGTVVSEGDAAWLKQRKFTGFKNASDKDFLDGNKHDITSPGQLDGNINNVTVNHDYVKWTYKVFDFDGNDYQDSYSVPGDTFTKSSSLTKTDDGHGNGYGGNGDHSCADAKDLTMWMDFDWTAQNVGVVDDTDSSSYGKSIFIVAGEGCELSGDQPDPDNYAAQSGSVRVTKHFGKEQGSYHVLGSCTVRFVYWDDSWSDQEVGMDFECTVKQ